MRKVIIIIPTVYENKEKLELLIASIYAKTKLIDFEVLPVLNNYTGITKAENHGFKKCMRDDADAVVLSDDSIIIKEDWLNNLQRTAYGNSSIGAVTGSDLYVPEQIGELKYRVAGFNPIYIKLSLLKRIGLMDENIPFYGEERDFGIRTYLAGYAILKIDTVVSHPIPDSTVSKGFKIEWWRDRHKEYLKRKWKDEV